MVNHRSIRPEDEPGVHARLDEKLHHFERGRFMGAVSHLLDQVKTLAGMLRDKEFTIDWPTRAKIIGGLLYFIVPIDMVPDFIPGLGYIDDAVVLALLMNSMAHVVRQYKDFRAARASGKNTIIDAEFVVRPSS